MLKNTKKNEERIRRHKRVRKVVNGTPDCPRLNVFRSNANIYAQVIDDTTGSIPYVSTAADMSITEEFRHLLMRQEKPD